MTTTSIEDHMAEFGGARGGGKIPRTLQPRQHKTRNQRKAERRKLAGKKSHPNRRKRTPPMRGLSPDIDE